MPIMLRDYLMYTARVYRQLAKETPKDTHSHFLYLGRAHMCEKMLEEFSDSALNKVMALKPEVYS